MKKALFILLSLALLGCTLAGCKLSPEIPTTTAAPTDEAGSTSAQLTETTQPNIIYGQRETLWEDGEYQVVKERVLGFLCPDCLNAHGDECLVAKNTWRLALIKKGDLKELAPLEALNDYSYLIEKNGRVFVFRYVRTPHSGDPGASQPGFVDLESESWQSIFLEDDRPFTGDYMTSSNRYAFLYLSEKLYQIDLETAKVANQFELPYVIFDYWEDYNVSYRVIEATDENLILSFTEHDYDTGQDKDLGAYRLTYATGEWTKLEP